MGVGGKPHAPAASTPAKDPVPILQEAVWAPGPVWTGEKSHPHRDSIPERPTDCKSAHKTTGARQRDLRCQFDSTSE